MELVLVKYTQTSELKNDNRTVQNENAEHILLCGSNMTQNFHSFSYII